MILQEAIDIADIKEKYKLKEQYDSRTEESFNTWFREDMMLFIETVAMAKGPIKTKFRILPNTNDVSKVGHIDFSKLYFNNLEAAAIALNKLNTMKVKDFILQFVERNTLIRLWVKVEGECQELKPYDKPYMEHELIRSNCKDMEVRGVTDILYIGSPYIEAVNLIIVAPEDFVVIIPNKVNNSSTEAN